MNAEVFTVWVSGGEVNSNLLTLDKALEIAEEWKAKGYEDVTIENTEFRNEPTDEEIWND